MAKTVLVMAAAISLGLLSPAHARPITDPPAWAAPGIAQAEDEVLSEPELRNALELAGYREIRVFQVIGDMYDMSARKDGQAVLLRLNARTRRYSERPAD